MNPADLADATAKALHLLTAGDPSHSDPRLHRDPRLVEEVRLTRESAADVWLAVSPLHVAPPDVLPAIMEQVKRQTVSTARQKSRVLPWLAASGWAAAALVAFLLWPLPGSSPVARGDTPRRYAPSIAPDSRTLPTAEVVPVPSSKEARLRSEIERLRARLTEMRERGTSDSPRVLSLSSPGGVRRSQEEARRRVRIILADALRSALEAESGAPSDPASLVIERGWLPGGLPVPAEGKVIRHRNFPEQSWADLGLLRSPDGEYFDSTGGTVWTPDPEGRGFIGKKISPDQDVSRFEMVSDSNSVKPARPRVLPEGFVIENPVDRTSEVVIDQVPEPTEGTAQFIVWKDTSGATSTLPLADLSTVSGTTGQYQDFGLSLSSGSLVFTIPNSNGVFSIELVERPIIFSGLPDRVIVGSQP